MALSFPKKKKLNEDLALQITSMADIFMILLVFLLKNYSANIVNISPSENTKLPVSSTHGEMKDALKVEISPSAILIDQKPVLRLAHFAIAQEGVTEDGSSTALLTAMQQERTRQKKGALDSNLMVMADERTPYDTLKAVLGSAAKAGFVDLQLVVVEGN